METTNNKEVVDVGRVLRLLWSKKKVFFIVWAATFVVSCLWVLPRPRYYSASVVLAPEKSGEDVGGSLGSLASSFGFNIGGGEDAIYPMLYPDFMSSNDFIISLFNIPVRSIDGDIDCDFYTYMDKYQKVAFYEVPFLKFSKWVRGLFAEQEPDVATLSDEGKKVNGIDPFIMTRRQEALVKLVRKDIGCYVDKKTEVVTISVKAQDKLIAATLADSVVTRLQNLIIDYRTSKARKDLDYYTQLSDEAKASYEEARDVYSSFADANADIYLPSYQTRLENLENEMQLRYNTYSSMVAQVEVAQAKVQERATSFICMESATVPQKPSEPKRMLFCIVMLFLATVVTIACVLVKNR